MSIPVFHRGEQIGEIGTQKIASQAFEDWWNRYYSQSDPGDIDVAVAKTVARCSWNAAIEHIRTTEPMPVSERILATLLRIETKVGCIYATDYLIDQMALECAERITDECEIHRIFQPGQRKAAIQVIVAKVIKAHLS